MIIFLLIFLSIVSIIIYSNRSNKIDTTMRKFSCVHPNVIGRFIGQGSHPYSNQDRFRMTVSTESLS